MNDHAPHADHEHEHPTWKQYKWVALWLTLITVAEVWIYYTPFASTSGYVPTLLLFSATKFAIVVMFYMHLKYDHKIFRALFRAADHRGVHADGIFRAVFAPGDPAITQNAGFGFSAIGPTGVS